MSNGNGTIKSVGIILTIVAGFLAIQREFNQKLDFAERYRNQEIQSINKKIDDVKQTLNCRLSRFEEWHDWWVKTITALNAKQNEQIEQGLNK